MKKAFLTLSLAALMALGPAAAPARNIQMIDWSANPYAPLVGGRYYANVYNTAFYVAGVVYLEDGRLAWVLQNVVGRTCLTGAACVLPVNERALLGRYWPADVTRP